MGSGGGLRWRIEAIDFSLQNRAFCRMVRCATQRLSCVAAFIHLPKPVLGWEGADCFRTSVANVRTTLGPGRDCPLPEFIRDSTRSMTPITSQKGHPVITLLCRLKTSLATLLRYRSGLSDSADSRYIQQLQEIDLQSRSICESAVLGARMMLSASCLFDLVPEYVVLPFRPVSTTNPCRISNPRTLGTISLAR